MTKRTSHRGVTSTPISLPQQHVGAEAKEPIATVEPTKLLLTPQEAADALSINRSTLYQLLMRGDIPSITIGRARRISVKWLEAWIEQHLAA